MEIEESLIGKIKTLCGDEFTANLEGIVGDYHLNKEINEKYTKWKKDPEVIDTSVIFFFILAYDIK